MAKKTSLPARPESLIEEELDRLAQVSWQGVGGQRAAPFERRLFIVCLTHYHQTEWYAAANGR